jgi:hypothetical protein
VKAGGCAQVAAALRSSPASLAAVQQAGGLRRITQLLQWAALAFPAPGSSQPQQPEPHPLQPPRELPVLATTRRQGSSPRAHFPGSPRTLLGRRGEPDQASPSMRGGSWEPPESPAAATPDARCRSRLGGGGASSMAPLAAELGGRVTQPWVDSPLAGRLSAGSLERLSPRLASMPEHRRHTDSDEPLLLQQQRQRSLIRRASGPTSFGAAAEKRASLAQLLGGRGEAAQQQRGGLPRGSLRLGRLPSLASAPAPARQDAAEARPMGPLAQAGLPALPSPALGEAFAVLEAWLGLAERQPPWGAQRAHWDRCLPLDLAAACLLADCYAFNCWSCP